jgi:hypothetical protein
VATPNQIKSDSPDNDVKFWAQEGLLTEFGRHLDDGISLNNCSSIQEIVGGLYSGDNRRWYDQAQDILNTLMRFNAYSAAKDLLSLTILHAFGGYYLDTTTFVTPGSSQSKRREAFSRDYDEPRIAGHPDTGVRHQLLLQSGPAIADGVDDEVEEVKIVELVDVWAMYSPTAQNPAVELMLKSYVSRCNRVGLNQDNFPQNFAGISGTTILAEGLLEIEGDRRNKRNKLIGQLIIRSVYDGLLVESCGGDESKLEHFEWPVSSVSQTDEETFGNYALPDLLINKRHAGTWRGVGVGN